MRFINTKVHSVLDYTVSVFVMLLPWIFGFNIGGVAQWTPVVLGILTFIMSTLTDYEGGVSKSIPMRTHLWLDVLSGIILATSPWLFGFAHQVYMPHVLAGCIEIIVPMFTHTVPYARHHQRA